ncbi:MAG: hypothetical protein ABR609_11040 [Acidimicrobiia bacterium]
MITRQVGWAWWEAMVIFALENHPEIDQRVALGVAVLAPSEPRQRCSRPASPCFELVRS